MQLGSVKSLNNYHLWLRDCPHRRGRGPDSHIASTSLLHQSRSDVTGNPLAYTRSVPVMVVPCVPWPGLVQTIKACGR